MKKFRKLFECKINKHITVGITNDKCQGGHGTTGTLT